MSNFTAIGATYHVTVTDQTGQPILDIDEFISLEYTRIVNGVGVCELVLPANVYDHTYFKIDNRIAVFRTIDGNRTYLDTETVFLIRKRVFTLDTISIIAVTPLFIFGDNSGQTGRFIAYDSATSNASFSTTPIDNIMKQIVRENATAIAGGRDVTATTSGVDISDYLTVQTNSGSGDNANKSCARRNVLRVLRELHDNSVELGTPIYFDIVSPLLTSLEFRTYVQQRGGDKRSSSANPVIFSEDDGNLADAVLVEDYMMVATAGIVGGRGTGSSRVVGTFVDTTRVARSVFGYREAFKNASYINETGTAATNRVNDEAKSLVEMFKPKTTFSGRIVETVNSRYGVDWTWGDYVTAQAFGQSFDCRINAVTVRVADNVETITAVLVSDA